MDTDDDKKMEMREKDFPDYNFLDKKLPGSEKVRVSVMIAKDIKYERLTHLEDDLNPLIVFRIKDSKAKWVNCIAFYRQWKDARDGELTATENT